MSELKYNPDLYVHSGYFDGDMDCEYVNESEKLVKVRKEHPCVGYGENCSKLIKPGQYAIKQTALFPGEGWKSCYICTNCIEDWLVESHQVSEED